MTMQSDCKCEHCKVAYHLNEMVRHLANSLPEGTHLGREACRNRYGRARQRFIIIHDEIENPYEGNSDEKATT